MERPSKLRQFIIRKKQHAEELPQILYVPNMEAHF